MIIIKRFTPKLLYTLSFPTLTHSPILPNLLAFSFASTNKNKAMKELHNNLINQATKLNNQTIIKSLHMITFKYEDTGSKKQLIGGDQLQMLIQKILRSSMMSLQHSDITLLLESLSEYKKYQKFNKNIGIYRQLAQRLNTLSTLKINWNYAYRLLHIMEELEFPGVIIRKYINYVTNYVIKKREKEQFSPLNTLRFFIVMMETKQISIQNLKKFYQTYVTNQDFKTGHQLCYLYYLRANILKQLQKKLKYMETRIEVHDILFNPFHHIVEQPQTPDQQKQDQKQQDQQKKTQDDMNTYQQEQLRIMREEINQLGKQIQNKFNLQKIEEELVKKYGFQHEALTPSLMILLLPIKKLSRRVWQEVTNNYDQMMPRQYIKIVTEIINQDNQEHLSRIHNLYCQKIWQFLKLGQKIQLLAIGKRLLPKTNSQELNLKYFTITPDSLKTIISQTKSITSFQFQLLRKIMLSSIPETHFQQILTEVEKILDRS